MSYSLVSKYMKLKKDDNVTVMAGKDKGKSGIIEYSFPETRQFVVKGIHVMKRHLKPSQKNPKGGIIDINKKLDGSNLMLICPNCGKNTRVGYKISREEKIRICHKCQKSVERVS